MPTYSRLKDCHATPDTLRLINTMIQLMELLLKCSQNHDVSVENPPISVQYLRENPANREQFEIKLNELRSIPQLTLSQYLEGHPNMQVALLTKVNELMTVMNNKTHAIMVDINALNNKVQTLEAELAQLRTAATQSTSRLEEQKNTGSIDISGKETSHGSFFKSSKTSEVKSETPYEVTTSAAIPAAARPYQPEDPAGSQRVLCSDKRKRTEAKSDDELQHKRQVSDVKPNVIRPTQ